jgi:hypothetical protein
MGEGFYEVGAILEPELQPEPSPTDDTGTKVDPVTSVTVHGTPLSISERLRGF